MPEHGPSGRRAEMSTWEHADGSLIWGEFSHVLDDIFFADGDEPVEVVERTWMLVAETRGTYYPPGHGTSAGFKPGSGWVSRPVIEANDGCRRCGRSLMLGEHDGLCADCEMGSA